jgi:hypothetical protein
LIPGQAPFGGSVSSIASGVGGIIAEVDFNYANTKLLVCGTSNIRIIPLTAAFLLTTPVTGASTTNTMLACKFNKNGDIGVSDSNNKLTVWNAAISSRLF